MKSNMFSFLDGTSGMILISIISYILGLFTKVITALSIDCIKQKKEKNNKIKKYKEIEKRYSKLISEIRKDLIEGKDSSPRVFIIKSRKTSYSNKEIRLEYFTDDHENLRETMLSLLELGVISKLSLDTFKLNEDFSEFLIQSGKEKK